MTKVSKKKVIAERDVTVEIIRVICVLFVIAIHTIDNCGLEKNSALYYFMAFIFRTGVPIFFILSGKYAFKINYDDNMYLEKYYKKKLLNLVLPVLIYMVIKEFHVMGYNLHKSITLYSYIRSLAVSIINGYNYMEYWFIYTLLANLLLVPFIGKFFQNITKKETKYFLIIPFLVNTISFLAVIFMKVDFQIKYALAGSSFYFYLGYFIDSIFNDKKKNNIIMISGLATFIISYLILININGMWTLLEYWSPIITIVSVALYVFLKNNSSKIAFGKKIILFIGKYSLGIYMTHMMYIYTLRDLLTNLVNKPMLDFSVIILAFGASLLTSFAIEKLIIKPLKMLMNHIVFKKIKIN